jgi:tRNA-specific 2-thiouridylase
LRLARGADGDKDQSYVLYMLDQAALRHTLLPIGGLTKAAVRDHARRLGLRTADKPDSQDVCFVTSTGGRRAFLGSRIPLKPARVQTADGEPKGEVDAVELVTIGQRKGLGLSGSPEPMYAIDVDRAAGTVIVGPLDDLLRDRVDVHSMTWADRPVDGDLVVQCSAHGDVSPARVEVLDPGDHTIGSALQGTGRATVGWLEPRPRVAPGQSVVLYDGDTVVGGGIAG